MSPSSEVKGHLQIGRPRLVQCRWRPSRAVVRAVCSGCGTGAKVIVDVGECGYRQAFAGEAVVGEDPLPPFHPNCSCTASAQP